ncbi:GPI transamidase component PIG-S [Copidosoma floridanum]|uniref:GPI transamidase component PIG-S n=1 Tax=Copidosoma floridanum TaxID=29053 RepID=UPI0006C9C73F|nr:GPI transamidase component PIG-S [Copidosoma floridanum]
MTDKESPAVIGHDTPTDRKCRVYASISFAVLLLVVGVPLWWDTTAVPRVALPYAGIKALSHLDLRIHVQVQLGCLDEYRCQRLATEIFNSLTASGHSGMYTVTVSHFVTGNSSIPRDKTIADLDRSAKSFSLTHGDILLLECAAEALGGNLAHVTSGRSIYFSSRADAGSISDVVSQWMLREKVLLLTRNALDKPTEYSLDVENRRRFPASPNYDVLLSLVSPDPERMRIDRGLARIAQDYLEPFVEELSLLANFSVKSQWLYLLQLGVEPKHVSDSSKFGRHFALTEDVLPQIITPMETKLASQVSLHPTINLVTYVVPCSNAPLHIYTRQGRRANKARDFEAFHSPRWGGIVIVNPPEKFCETTKESDVFTPDQKMILEAFITQLRLLLGITDKESIGGVGLAPLEGLKPRGWEVDDLLRIRSVEQLTSAKLTLQSLARLLKEISNIVITDQVGERINRALTLIQRSTELLSKGDLKNGFLASKEAFVQSEAAFTDPSLLALLYFPDDQKYAVYIPLFLPVMIPVLFSLKNIKNYLFCSN